MTKKFILLFSTILLSFIACEIGIRLLGYYDINGNFRIGTRILKPYQLPQNIDEWVNRYLSDSSSYVVYDSLTGWIPRPNFRSANGWFRHNAQGIRSDKKEYSFKPDSGKTRIALFGDSHIWGDEIPFDSTMGYFLEKNMQGAEVINFGVGAYGIDQAYLRWKHFGKKFNPHIVIFGFQPENMLRNLNLVRCLYAVNEKHPLLKPRFVLENDELKLVNSPTPPPQAIPAIINNFEDWELARYEHYYDNDDYDDKIWRKSRFSSYTEDVLEYNRFTIPGYERQYFGLNYESAKITLKIIESFKKEVKENGGIFLIVHIPRKGDLKNLIEEKPLAYKGLLNEIEKIAPVIHSEKPLLRFAKNKSTEPLYKPRQHLSGKAHQIIAEETHEYLLQLTISKF